MAKFGCGGINFEIKKLKFVVGSLKKKKKWIQDLQQYKSMVILSLIWENLFFFFFLMNQFIFDKIIKL